MKAKDLRKQSKQDLQKRLAEKQTELIEKRFDVRIGQETDYSSIKKTRREIARIKTLLNTEIKEEKKPENIEETDKNDGKKEAKSDKITKSQSKSK